MVGRLPPPERRRKWVQRKTERRLQCRSPSPALRRSIPSLNNHYDLPNIHHGIRHGQVTQMRDKYSVVNFIMSPTRERAKRFESQILARPAAPEPCRPRSVPRAQSRRILADRPAQVTVGCGRVSIGVHSSHKVCARLTGCTSPTALHARVPHANHAHVRHPLDLQSGPRPPGRRCD